MIRVEAFFDTWKTIRQDTAQAVEDFPPAEFDFKPVPELMSFREIARHILDAGHALTGVLNDGFEDLASCRQLFKDYAVPLAADAEPAALAAALRDSLALRTSQTLQKPPEFFSGLINADGRAARDAAGNVPVHQGARGGPPRPVVPVSPPQGHRAGHHPPPAGQAIAVGKTRRVSYKRIVAANREGFQW